MNDVACRERTFSLWLPPHYTSHYITYLYWLRQMLERLGREAAGKVWQNAFAADDDTLLLRILSTGWEEVADEEEDVAAQVEEGLDEVFPVPIEGVSREEARRIIEGTPPFRQIREHLPSLKVRRQISTYDRLHLFRGGLARLAESLIAYDAMLDELTAGQKRRLSVAEFMSARLSRFLSGPAEPDIFTAGLEVELIRGSETEVVTRVKECEWARYFQERHPRVGYLLACSLDNAAYRSFNERIRLQRTTTLMEGGEACDFRVYALEGVESEFTREETAPEVATVGPDAVVGLREITAETVVPICKLTDTLPEPQRRMVAPNALSIAQAHFSEHAWFRAIYADETPVGFIMLYDDPEKPEYFLWRLMIAGSHQGKGFGRRAMELLVDYVRTRPGATELLTSCQEGEGSPEGFYHKLGFERTGEMYGNEVGLGLLL